ncbi:helix-turn-helix domain-containing protein [Alicyclobacillus sendaiensis]|uniref:Helix-turn-helix transcriptional regulator n=1 Tax=Alicyclobacillus sendaiensis PA2 TaxID=3029425 RepID=A0ABT6Y1R7_ALISE|nr:helix-turn-helix transcriptional regulator [Alicyclobacillus sendaiensis]MDI9261295.1 helix-turn-helix transcriptional regulator [Alicyclobacillus sendaiensis PA2]
MSSADALVQAIQTLCEERRLSINALARRAGLRQSTIDSILKGKSRNPKFETLEKIAAGFGMNVDEFSAYVRNFGTSTPMTPPLKTEDDLLIKFRKLSTKQRDVISQLIDLLIESN